MAYYMKFCCFLKKTNYLSRSFIFISIFVLLTQSVFAESPKIIDFKINGKAENVTFNPNNGESVSIEVKADKPVKFTRLYICSTSQSCTGSSGNYTRYFTQSTISDTISKIWNGKTSGDAGFAPSGEYRIMASMIEDGGTPITEFGRFSIFLDFTSQPSTTSSQTEDTEGDNTPEDYDGAESAVVSTHSSTGNLSDYKDNSNKLKISAGRERLSYVNFPLEFSAESNISSALSGQFDWSFGDGLGGTGKNVSHTYKNVGEYILILNSTNGTETATARTKVTILKPDLGFERVETNGISIKNNGLFEINIGGLKLQKGLEVFNIVKDTIIPAGKNIVLSEVFKNTDNKQIVLRTDGEVEIAKIDTKKANKDNDVASIGAATKKESLVTDEEKFNSFISEFKKISAQSNKQTKIDLSKLIQTATVLDSVESDEVSSSTPEDNISVAEEEPKGFWQKIWYVPISLFRSIKSSFYDVE